MSIRILIIDEHKSARETLARRLGTTPGMEVVGSTGDSEEGIRQMKELRPDVVLLDIKMKKADGIDICRRVCSAACGAKVAILTSYGDLEERSVASSAGVSGYLLKDVDTPKLAQWIRRLILGNGDSSKV